VKVVRRIVWIVVAIPAGLVLVTLAVANRHSVRLVLDPFRRADPVIALELPFYAYLFGALLVGVVIGGMATWMSQARWRRAARHRAVEAQRWQAEADRLGRERELEASRQLVPANR
jgi:Zn-dependent protease